MSTEQLLARVRRHNMLAIALAVALVPVAVALLRRLDLFWLEDRGDGAYIRYPAGVE